MAAMETISTINFIGTALFAIAILHTFSTKYFEQLAHTTKKIFWHPSSSWRGRNCFWLLGYGFSGLYVYF